MNAKEFQYNDVVINGFVALFVNLAILPLLIVMSFVLFKGSIVLFMLLILFLAAAILMIPGYFSQEPNEARAMVFFGKYKGTFTETGFFWVNPFMNKKKLSLRARNLDIEPIKVNDKIGNPILIGLVLVWKLKDTELDVNGIRLDVNGAFRRDTVAKTIGMDLEYGLHAPSMETVLRMIPKSGRVLERNPITMECNKHCISTMTSR